MKRNLIYLFLILCISISCGKRDISKERAEIATSPGKYITIGVAWTKPDKNDKFRQGLELAQRDLNNAGGILKRQIKLVYADDQADITKGRLVAQNMANNPEIMAVIGHRKSYITNSCASIYEFEGLVMLSPKSTSPKFTRKGYKHVFRTVPSDDVIGIKLAEFMAEKKYKRIAILYVKSDYGSGLANAFENRADELELEIVDRQSYMHKNKELYRKIIRTWKDEYIMDAIFLASSVDEAAEFIKLARSMGLNVPIVGGDSLNSPKLYKIAGRSANGVVVPSVFYLGDPNPEVKKFVKSFKKTYKETPDLTSALGYDTLKLLSYTMNKTGTFLPDKVAARLHSVKEWKGLAGNYTFNDKGDNIGMKIKLLKMLNNKFIYIKSK